MFNYANKERGVSYTPNTRIVRYLIGRTTPCTLNYLEMLPYHQSSLWHEFPQGYGMISVSTPNTCAGLRLPTDEGRHWKANKLQLCDMNSPKVMERSAHHHQTLVLGWDCYKMKHAHKDTKTNKKEIPPKTTWYLIGRTTPGTPNQLEMLPSKQSGEQLKVP